jgi:hypothetical protein
MEQQTAPYLSKGKSMQYLLLCFALALQAQAQQPAGWTSQNANGRVRVTSPDGREFVSIEALSLSRAATSADRMLKELKGHGRYLGGRSPSASSATAAFLDGANRVHALLTIRGGMGTLMLAGAPAATFASRLPALVKILGSLSLTPATGPQASVDFVRIQEAKESAFSIEVPRGWKSEAALYRLGATDTRSEVQTMAPDSSVWVFSGDRNIGKFMTLSPQLLQLGAREGGVYNTGTSSFTYMRFLPGAQFAQGYVQRRFAAARILASRDLPELAQRMAAQRYRLGNPMGGRLDCGEVDFEYQGKSGRVLVTTEISSSPMGNSFWSVTYLQGYLALPGKDALSQQVLTRLMESARVNPQWMMGELRMQADIAQQNIEALHNTQRVQAQMINERWASETRRAQGRGEELLGRYQVQDPATGEQYTVAAGSNYYYRLGRNGVAGSNTQLGNTIQGEGGPIEVTPLLRVGVE